MGGCGPGIAAPPPNTALMQPQMLVNIIAILDHAFKLNTEHDMHIIFSNVY